MFSPYSSSTSFSALVDVPAQDLIPIEECGIPSSVAQLLSAAAPRAARALKQWLLRMAESPRSETRGQDGRLYSIGALPKSWHGRVLRAWIQEQRELQEDASELTLRGARLAPGVQVYSEAAVDCVDGQSVISITPAGQESPAGYATVKLSLRIPRFIQSGTGFRVSECFEDFHDLRAPQVELKVVLDEVFVLPEHRGNGLGNALAQAVQSSLVAMTGSLEFLMAHAPMMFDLDAEVVSFAGANYVNRVRELLCEALATEGGWMLETSGYPLEYCKGALRLHLRHDFS